MLDKDEECMRFMITQCHQKRGWHSFTLSGMLLLMAALLLCTMPVTAIAEEPAPAASKTNTAPCKDLKPFNNIDELLYQFYINLDSDCLFTMSVAELEKIWGIKILTYDQRKPGESHHELRMSSDFEGKPYKSEKDAFYVETSQRENNPNTFYIEITKEYYEKHATLFPDGEFPKMLPAPLREMVVMLTTPPLEGKETLRPKKPGVYNLTFSTYYWLSSDRMRMISLEGFYGVTSIKIVRKRTP